MCASPPWHIACNPKDLPMGISKGGNAQIKGPSNVDRVSVTKWLDTMKKMRDECQKALGFNGSIFDVPELKWTQTSYYQPQMHPYDRFFFDPSLGNGTNSTGYTVARWLEDLKTRFGGIDSALLWPVYTNLGIDDRNQFDLTRSLPGGTDGLKMVIKQLHDAGVRVLWAYNKWDSSTKGSQWNRDTDPLELAKLLRDTGADGFNGDTMGNIPQSFFDAAIKIYKPIAGEAEGGLSTLTNLNYDTIGWAEGWYEYEPGVVNNIPNVDKAKWISDGKAMSHWSDRYSGSPVSADETGGTSKIPELQVAWFNGVGFETWENIWGVWNQIVERDAEALRRMGVLLRYFGYRGFLQSAEWVPHTLDVLQMQQGIFGSAFPSPDGKEVLYALVNRKRTSLHAAHLQPNKTVTSGMHFYDCYHGVELHPQQTSNVISFEIEGNGFGCVLVTKNSTIDEYTPFLEDQLRDSAPLQPMNLTALLQTMHALTKRNLSSFSPHFHYLKQEMIPIAKTPLRPLHNASSKEVYVPGSMFYFEANGVEIEGGAGSGVDVQWPWEDHPQRRHNHTLHVGAMYVDKYPVTNADYYKFLRASKYMPSDSAHWLEQNFEAGKPKTGWERKPVTYVSLQDAREYCSFYSKRLPHAFEWQYFAQGTDGRLYPWGSTDDVSLAPSESNNFTNPGPEIVGKYAHGASPFGVEDLIRSVWQYTTEFQDTHTRAVILRGGSNYCPWRGTNTTAPGSYDPHTGKNLTHPYGGSRWYFRPAFRLDNYNKYFLMSGSYERAGTIGFRCVADAVDDCGTDGTLCISSNDLNTSIPLDEDSTILDWLLLGVGAANATVRKETRNMRIGLPRGFGVSGATSMEISRTNFSLHNRVFSHTGLIYTGQSNGFELTVPAPPLKKQLKLNLYVSSKLGAHGNLTAMVGKRHTSLQIRPHLSVISLTYRDGPLNLRYINANSSVCSNTHLCLLSTQFVCAPGFAMTSCIVTLSKPGVIDWAHWGNLNNSDISVQPTGLWFTNRMQNGSNLLHPTLQMPEGINVSDLDTWSGKFWPSDRLIYSWSNGTPIKSAGDTDWWTGKLSPRSGVTSEKGIFTLTIASPSQSGQQRKLTLYLGLFNYGAFGNSAILRISSPGQPTIKKMLEHDNGNNNDWQNYAFTIIFDGTITITWSLGPCNLNNKRCGLVSWQAATLENYNDGIGGIAIQAVVLHSQV